MRTLSRKKAHRESMLRNLLTSLFLYESLETTEAKAKELKILCDSTITRAKEADLEAIKFLNSVLLDNNAIKKVIQEILPRFSNRKSGFCRIYKTSYRVGDNAAMARIELIDKKVFVEDKKIKAQKAEKVVDSEAEADAKKPRKAASKVKQEGK